MLSDETSSPGTMLWFEEEGVEETVAGRAHILGGGRGLHAHLHTRLVEAHYLVVLRVDHQDGTAPGHVHHHVTVRAGGEDVRDVPVAGVSPVEAGTVGPTRGGHLLVGHPGGDVPVVGAGDLQEDVDVAAGRRVPGDPVVRYVQVRREGAVHGHGSAPGEVGHLDVISRLYVLTRAAEIGVEPFVFVGRGVDGVQQHRPPPEFHSHARFGVGGEALHGIVGDGDAESGAYAGDLIVAFPAFLGGPPRIAALEALVGFLRGGGKPVQGVRFYLRSHRRCLTFCPDRGQGGKEEQTDHEGCEKRGAGLLRHRSLADVRSYHHTPVYSGRRGYPGGSVI